MWTDEREMRRVEFLFLNGDAIKMDVKPIEWKGLVPLGQGLIWLGTGTDMAREWYKEWGLAYAVRGVCLP